MKNQSSPLPTLTNNNSVQLWRKADAAISDAATLMRFEADEHTKSWLVLQKLRLATSIMQEIERRSIGQGAPR